MCVDFKDLNKAYPKDDLPLTHINVLMDNTTGSALMSFIDGFSGYNQIKMAYKDMIKTTFSTKWGIYWLYRNIIWTKECRCNLPKDGHSLVTGHDA